jgi:hypothetical protein
MRLHRSPARWLGDLHGRCSRPLVRLAPAKCSKGARGQTSTSEQLWGQCQISRDGFEDYCKLKKLNLFRGCVPPAGAAVRGLRLEECFKVLHSIGCKCARKEIAIPANSLRRLIPTPTGSASPHNRDSKIRLSSLTDTSRHSRSPLPRSRSRCSSRRPALRCR